MYNIDPDLMAIATLVARKSGDYAAPVSSLPEDVKPVPEGTESVEVEDAQVAEEDGAVPMEVQSY
jgi:hypothetical protein